MPEQIKAGRRWRKKPVVIEAERWDGTVAGATRLIDWLLARHATARYHDATDPGEAGNRLAIDTLEGTMTAQPGDWIICGVQGEFYPCKPDVFEATYEPADQQPQMCPEGCGCRVGTNDADRFECGCDGPCTG